MALSACRCPRAMRTSSYPRARQSPFGKGAETVVDTSVRKSWQLDPTQFSLRNPKWKAMMDQILQKVDTGLHLHCGAESVSAELYKLLLYEEGAFFKPHKDSEKSPGMFGTLVVCLPSSHQGGELVLSHNHEKVELKTAPTSDFDMSYAAWYSDVLHEVKPVTQGYRLVLVYNLVKRNPTTMLMPLSLTSHQDRLVAVLRQWFVEPNAPQWPEYLVHRFEHQYTQASLRPDLLKGADLEQTRYLKAAAAELGFSLYLATLERTVIEDEEAEEEIDRTAALKHVVTMDGVRVDDPKSDKGMVIPEDHLLADDDVRLDEADDEDHSGYTGNEGVTATCFYRDTQGRVSLCVRPETAESLVQIQQLRHEAQHNASDSARKELVELSEAIMLSRRRARLWVDGYKDWADGYTNWTFEGITLETFRLFGIILGQGVAARQSAQERIARAVKAARSLMDKHKAIQTIQEALEQSPASDNSSEEEFTTVLKWLGDISMTVLQGAVHSKGLTKVEGETLARFLEFWDVNSIKDQVIPLIEQSSTSCKLGFVNWLLAPIDEPTTTAVQKRRSRDGDGAPPQPQPAKLSLETKQHLTKPLLSNIWSDFRLKAPPWPKAPPSTYRSVKSISHWSVTENQEDRSSRFVNGGDLRQLINHTVSAGAVSESEIKDRLSKAVRTADKETYVHALLPFVEEILAQKVSCYNNKHGGEIDTETGELSQQSMEFVTHLLLNDLKTCVGKEPRGQVKWSQPRRGCGCRDCLGVDAFLASPTESVGRFPCAKPRRQHLHQQFNRSPNTPYTIETTHNSNPHVWQITKKNKQLERQAVWRKDRDEARSWLAWLQNAVRNPNRPLRDYLGTMADAILAADYDRVAQEHEAALARLDATVGGDEERRQDLDAPVGGDEEPRQDGLSLSSPRRPLVPSTSTSNVPSGGERSGSKRPADAGGDARAKKSRTGSSKRGESESEFTMTENGAVEVIDLT